MTNCGNCNLNFSSTKKMIEHMVEVHDCDFVDEPTTHKEMADHSKVTRAKKNG